MPWDRVDKRFFNRDLFIALFLLIGSLVGFSFLIFRCWNKITEVQSWVETPCVIDSVYIDTDHISEPARFFWNITYSYECGSQHYTSDRYGAMERYKHIVDLEKQRIDKEKTKWGLTYEPKGPYSVGENTICYVNPKIPSEAVLVQSYSWKNEGFDAIALLTIFSGLGLVLLIQFVRTYRY